MTTKDDNGEILSKSVLDWLTRLGAIATALTTIFALFFPNLGDDAKRLAYAVAILLLVGSGAVYYYQRRRVGRVEGVETVEVLPEVEEPSAPTAILRGSLPFEEGDLLPLRGKDIQQLYTLVASSTFRFGVLWGTSGCGKTSLLRAGLAPMLRKNGYLPVYVATPAKEPRQAIYAALKAGVQIPGTDDPKLLLEILIARFNDSELRALCFDLNIDYENLRGQGKADKAMELVTYCERHDRVSALSQALRNLRPNAFTPDVSKGTPAEQLPSGKEAGASPGQADEELGLLRVAVPKGKKIIVLLDQFEEAFLGDLSSGARESFIKWMGACVADSDLSVAFLVCIRASFLAQLEQLASYIPNPTSPHTMYQLQNFDSQQAKQILVNAAKTDAIAFEPALINAVMHDLERDGIIRPSELQTVGTRLKLKNIRSLDKYVSPLLARVLIIVFNPIVDPASGRTLIETSGWNDPDALVAEYIQDIQECSDGLVIYQIVERNQFVGRVEVSEFPVKADGFQYQPQDYINALRGRIDFHVNDMVDYGTIIKEFNLLQRIANNEFDEVWLFGFPYSGFYESTMAGKDAFWCNSPPVPNTEQCRRRFIILGFNYARGVGEMLEDLGHRAESIMQKVYKSKLGNANLFERFTLYEKIAPGQANVGRIHFAPNSVRDYDWANMTPVRSFCDDWYQFPNMTGMVRTVNASEWGRGDIREHHKWWLKHLPKAQGTTDGIANNWWKYIINPNNVD